MPEKAGFLRYLQRAFLFHWNLLAVGAGVAAGLISGHADIVLPLLAAGEMAYLAGLAAHPKFQAYVDARAHGAAREASNAQLVPALQHISRTLDPRARARFDHLRARCRQLRELAGGLKDDRVGLDRLQVEGINKLLWVFLKLLYSRQVLRRFLDSTQAHEIRDRLAELRRNLDALGPAEGDTPESARRRRTLEDTIASTQLRLDNYDRAVQNFEYIELELDRIQSKITSIAELAVNRQDPDFVTHEVDGVAATMAQTEAAMSELNLLSELDSSTATPPDFLEHQLEAP